jgi:hypothetical protein
MQCPSQASIWKKMPLSEKYQLLAATVRQSRKWKRMGIRLRRPNASPEAVEKELDQSFLDGMIRQIGFALRWQAAHALVSPH